MAGRMDTFKAGSMTPDRHSALTVRGTDRCRANVRREPMTRRRCVARRISAPGEIDR